MSDAIRTLINQFGDASSKWPNLQCVLLSWPKGTKEPYLLHIPEHLRMQNPYIGSQDERTVHLYQFHIGWSGEALSRLLRGREARLYTRCSFGYVDQPHYQIHTPEFQKQAMDRFVTLADLAANQTHVERVNGIYQHRAVDWLFALHRSLKPTDLVVPMADGRRDVEARIINDVYLASVEMLTAGVAAEATKPRRSRNRPAIQAQRAWIAHKLVLNVRPELEGDWQGIYEYLTTEGVVVGPSVYKPPTKVDSFRRAVQRAKPDA